jgi:hypothetical protein
VIARGVYPTGSGNRHSRLSGLPEKLLEITITTTLKDSVRAEAVMLSQDCCYRGRLAILKKGKIEASKQWQDH